MDRLITIDEAKREFREWLIDNGARDWPTNDRIRDKAAEIFSRVQEESIAEGFTECDTCRGKPGAPILCSGCLANRRLIANLENAAYHLAELAKQPTPEVIVGKGQAVTQEQVGRYVFQCGKRGPVETCVKLVGDIFHRGCKYIRCPEFPQPKPFVAPPKPEIDWRVIRVTSTRAIHRAYRHGDSWYSATGLEWSESLVEELDETTGEPIAKGE